MSKELPLLIFPKPKPIDPSKRKGFRHSDLHFPDHEKQIERLTPKIEKLKASVSGTVTGLEPETVLVIEIVDSVEGFRQAVEKTGLEWIGEWDIDDIEADDDFYVQKNQQRIEKNLKRQLFVSFLNQEGLKRLLSLWEKWKNQKKFDRGETKWKYVFTKTRDIRQWGIEETLVETGMIDRWKKDLIDLTNEEEPISFQIDLFYRDNKNKQEENERSIEKFLKTTGGKKISSINRPQIAFHSIKAELPAKKIKDLLQQIESNNQSELNIQLFKFPGVMYFRPTGQSISVFERDTTNEKEKFPIEKPELPPIAAILDGAPNIKHEALDGRILLDDPDSLSSEYQPGERLHGTSMASLVIHGDLSDPSSVPLSSQVYHLPIMQSNPKARNFGKCEEYFPDQVFFEDRIERAVRRIFEGEGNTPAQASTVKIINLSIADLARPFIHTLSPLARLLDYLSFKYRVLFCVSAGNFTDKINLEMPVKNFIKLPDAKKKKILLKIFKNQLSNRRLLSPAESLNSLTIGALHSDHSGEYNSGHHIDLLPNEDHFVSPISRFGYGFRRSIKPEILLPGGRQLYKEYFNGNTNCSIVFGNQKPGQQTAWDSSQAGEISKVVYTRGTSNATALATRSGVKIYEMLSSLNKKEKYNPISENLIAILIKTLLVHSAEHNDSAVKSLVQSLEISEKKKKEILSRYIGYGNANINRVLSCAENRSTVIGFGEIEATKAHEYNFPLPIGLSDHSIKRQMLVTLAWFSPINPKHRNLREAKLEVKSSENWNDTPLKLKRKDSSFYQVIRGTVQHEVFKNNTLKTASYGEGKYISLQVVCKADATESLEDKIPYGLAVTLEVEGNIPIYSEIRQRLKQSIPIKT